MYIIILLAFISMIDTNLKVKKYLSRCFFFALVCICVNSLYLHIHFLEMCLLLWEHSLIYLVTKFNLNIPNITFPSLFYCYYYYLAVMAAFHTGSSV